jgi:NAD(P)-dependent dehydrogenase (short-subunit alcohol dehydrogenase family)
MSQREVALIQRQQRPLPDEFGLPSGGGWRTRWNTLPDRGIPIEDEDGSIMAVSSKFFDLTAHTAIVTGGAGSLGSAISKGLAAAGAKVAVADLQQKNVDRVREEITRAGGRAEGFACDSTREAEVISLFDKVEAALGPVDILVNAVACPIARHQPQDVSLDTFRGLQEGILNCFFLTCREAGRRMIAAKRPGSIVNFGSIAGENALGRGAMPYGVAKAGVGQLTRELAFAWAHHGIRVNAILPCQFMNSMWAEQIANPKASDLLKTVIRGIPLGRLGEPEEVVGPVIFLASEASSMITGVLLPVDGGNLAMNAGGSVEW